jgi:hypothetical protein
MCSQEIADGISRLETFIPRLDLIPSSDLEERLRGILSKLSVTVGNNGNGDDAITRSREEKHGARHGFNKQFVITPRKMFLKCQQLVFLSTKRHWDRM